MRALLFGFLVLGMLAAGCSSDDDDASDVTTTTSATSTTAVPDDTEPSVSTKTTEASDETAPREPPELEIGQSAEIDDGVTVSVTSIEVDPEPACVPGPGFRYGNEDRYLLVRGTLEDPAQAWVEPGGETTLIAAYLGPPNTRPWDDTEVAFYLGTAMDPAELADDGLYDVEWCFYIPADEPSWALVVPAHGSEGSEHPPGVWNVSI